MPRVLEGTTLLFALLVIILFLTLIFYAWREERGSVHSMFACLSLAILLVALLALSMTMMAVGISDGCRSAFFVFIAFLLLLTVFFTLLWC